MKRIVKLRLENANMAQRISIDGSAIDFVSLTLTEVALTLPQNKE